jgi:PAS domain S-box-containing protein
VTSARPPSPNPHPRGLQAYVGTVVALAIACVALAVTYSSLTFQQHVFASMALLVLAVSGQLLRIRFDYGRHHDDWNFFEVALAAVFALGSMLDVLIITAVATAVGLGVQRVREHTKFAFNIAQWVIAAVAGRAIYIGLTQNGADHSQVLLAVTVAAAGALLVNQALLTTAMKLATGRAFGACEPGQIRAVVIGRALGLVASVALGTVLALSALWTRWAILLAGAPLLLLHWASKAYAEARADRLRLAGLQHITHELSVSIDLETAIPRALAEARAAFEVGRAELWTFNNGRLECSYADGADAVGDVDEQARWVAEILRPAKGTCQLVHPVYRSAVVAPMRSGEKTQGALCLLGRVGMEGWENGELAVATALGAELIGFMQRARLTQTVVEERAKLAQIVEQTSDGILTLSPDGRIRSWNRALEQITGYFAIEMAGTAHLALIRPSDESGNEIALERWVDIPELPERIQIRTSSGDSRWLSCSFTRVAGTSKQEETLIVVARDVTAAHELERLKDDFVAVVSHELRTPLVPIKGWASMLLTRGDRMTEDQRHDALESIHTQAQRLERLVLNILDSSRIEGGVDHTASNIDISVVAARVVEEMLPSASGRAIHLYGANQRHIALGQPVWLERALANLIANAIKYAPADTDVNITISTEGHEVVVRVRDDGPGIPHSWRERIFERFERVPGSDTQTGTGLGLYITRQLVMAMGGTVVVDPDSEAGTTFVMRLRASNAVPLPRSEHLPSLSVD